MYGMRYNKNVMMKSGSESKLGAIVNISRILLCLLSLRTLKEESLLCYMEENGYSVKNEIIIYALVA
jgi:hypothetical protein